MTFKILLFILFLIVAEIYRLFKEGIMEHKFAFGKTKVDNFKYYFYFNFICDIFYLGIQIKIKEAIPPIIKTAAKAFATPIKTPKKVI